MATRKYTDYLQDSIHEEIRRLKNLNNYLYSGRDFSLSGYTREGILVTGLSVVNQNLHRHNLIYRLTNTITGSFYIGKHSTFDPLDSYYGSGIILQEAQLKYGLSVFTKEIMFDFKNVDDCYNKEAELVPEISCHQFNPSCYNMKPGGYGGVTKEGARKIIQTKKENGYKISELTKRRISESNRNKPKSTIHRQHLSDHHRTNREYTI